MKRLATFLLMVAALESIGQAQQVKAGFNGFSFTSPLEISAGADRNFLVDRLTPDQKLFFLSLSPTIQSGTPLGRPGQNDDAVALLTLPTSSIIADGRRRQFAVSYQPEFEIFQHNSDQNSWNHNANVEFIYYLGRRLTASVRDAYRSSSDPARTLQNVFLLLPRSRYSENGLRSALEFQYSPLTSFGAQFDNTRTQYGSIDRFQFRILDTTGNAVSLNASHLLSQSQRIRGTYTIFRVTPINKSGIGDEEVDAIRLGMDKPMQSFSGDYRVALSSSAVVEVGAGYLLSPDRGNTYTLRAGGDKRVGQVWIGGGYARSVALLGGTALRVLVPNGMAANDVFDVVTVRARGEPLRRVAIDTAIVGSRAVSAVGAGHSRASMARARLDYRWSERVTTFVTAERYQQNRNEFVSAPLERIRLFGGIQYSFSTEEERRINRLNRDADYVSLTGRDRPRRLGPLN